MKKRNLALLLTAALLSMGGCAAGGEISMEVPKQHRSVSEL